MTGEENPLEEIGIDIPTHRCKLPLDPIKTAASVETYEPILKWALRVSAKWATDATLLVIDSAYYVMRMRPRKVEQQDSIFKVWETTDLTRKEMEHLAAKETKMFRQLGEGEEYLSRARLFKTEKDEVVARLVSDGRETNMACDGDLEFQLAKVEEVIRAVIKLGKAFYVVADARHWFYAHRINEAWARTMAVLFQGTIYLPIVMAMGHTASAYCGGLLCWAMVLMSVEDDPKLGVRQEDLKNKPTILFLYDGETIIGFIVVYIDNILVACKDEALARRWETRLYKNARRLRKVHYKHDKVFLFLDGKLNYLGVEYEWISDDVLKWHWSEDRRNEWKREFSSVTTTQWTDRRVASWVGTSVWKTRIAMKPLFIIREFIELTKEMGKKNKRRKNWDEKVEMSTFEKIKDLLNDLWKFISTKQEWTASRIEDRPPTVFVVVDACTSTGRGIVRYDGRGEVLQEIFHPNGVDDISFILETQVIYEMLLSLCECQQGRPNQPCTFLKGQVIRCGSDCVAAIYCIVKFYSRNPKACDIVKLAWEWLQRHDGELQMRFVQGIMMAADQTSRLETLDAMKVKASWERLQMTTMEMPKKKARNDGSDPEYE